MANAEYKAEIEALQSKLDEIESDLRLATTRLEQNEVDHETQKARFETFRARFFEMMNAIEHGEQIKAGVRMADIASWLNQEC